MGVEQTHYVMYGVKLDRKDPLIPEDPYEDDLWAPLVEGHKDSPLRAVYTDVMSGGGHLIVGKVICEADMHEGMDFTAIGISEQAMHDIDDELDKLGVDGLNERPHGYYAFTQWH